MVFNLVSALVGILPDVLILGSLLGLLGGLTIGVIDFVRFRAKGKSNDVKSPPTFWRSAANVLVVGLILLSSVGLLGGLVSAFIFQSLHESGFDSEGFLIIAGLIGLLTGPMAGLIGALNFGLRGMRQSLANDIQTVESLSWSWNQSRQGIPLGLMVGLAATLIASWLARFLGSPHPLLEGLGLGLCIGLLGPLFRGLRAEHCRVQDLSQSGNPIITAKRDLGRFDCRSDRCVVHQPVV